MYTTTPTHPIADARSAVKGTLEGVGTALPSSATTRKTCPGNASSEALIPRLPKQVLDILYSRAGRFYPTDGLA
jgi:hypothetical protein